MLLFPKGIKPFPSVIKKRHFAPSYITKKAIKSQAVKQIGLIHIKYCFCCRKDSYELLVTRNYKRLVTEEVLGTPVL